MGFSANWRRRRGLTVTAGATLAAVAATALTGGVIATAGASAATAEGNAATAGSRSFGAEAGSVTATAAESLSMLPAGRVGARAAIPWRLVGPGWALAEFTTGSAKAAGPVWLFLVDPAGGRYRVYRWAATGQPWQLVDWSGDKARALFENQGGSRPALHQLVLASGKVSTFRLPSATDFMLGYTRPSGTNILVSGHGIARYNLAGVPQAQLISGSGYNAALSSADGTTEVVNGSTGVELVSNTGGVIRRLHVPGATAKLGGCTPVRWWNSSTALVSCVASTAIYSPRIWLVPVSGSAPLALTAVRNGRDGDYGDTDAWRFGKTVYVQALGACGVRYIGRQRSNGSVAPVNVPGSAGNNAVVATAGHRMLVQEFSECTPSSSVVWFSPATGATQDVLMAPESEDGVVSVVAYNRDGEQPSVLP